MPAFTFTETRDALIYEEHGSQRGVRIAAMIAVVLGLVFSPFFAWLAFDMRPIDTAAKIGGVVASVVGILAFVGFGAFCLRIALFLPMQAVCLEHAGGRLVRTTRAPATGVREHIHAIEAIRAVELRAHDPEDGPRTFAIVIALASAPAIEMGAFTDKVEARRVLADWRSRLGVDTSEHA